MFSRILHTLGEKSTRMRFSILYLSTDVSSVMGKPRHTAGSRQEGYFALPLHPIPGLKGGHCRVGDTRLFPVL